MSSLRFTWVLKSQDGGPFALYQICNDEITWKNGYEVVTYDECISGNHHVAAYHFNKVGNGSRCKNNLIRRQTEFRTRLRNQHVPCVYIVQRAKERIVDIDLNCIKEFMLQGFIEPKSMSLITKWANEYDPFAPVKK